MENARRWVYNSDVDAPIPYVIIDNSPAVDKNFVDIDRGVSVVIKCDRETSPSDLSWIKVRDAKIWLSILCIKTGLGAIKNQEKIKVFINLINDIGEDSQSEKDCIEYLWIHDLSLNIKKAELSRIQEHEQKLVKKRREITDLNNYPSSLKHLDIIYEFYEVDKIIELINDLDIKDDELRDSILNICNNYTPYIYCCYSYSESFWDELNNNLGTLRRNYKFFKSGIQLAADNMPQGEIRPIDYKSVNADRTYLLIHFSNCEVDYGRKSFPKELEDFAQDIAKKLVIYFSKYRVYSKKTTGKKRNLQRRERVARYTESVKNYASQNPLSLDKNKYHIPMICNPAREQEVIALFNQLLGAKIINGIEIISTDQNFIYDGVYQIKVDTSEEHIYHPENNLLGLFQEEIIKQYQQFGLPFSSSTQVVEYKFSIDNLIEDLKDGEKNSNDIDMLVVWETGNKWRNHYHITSCLDQDNISHRPYHGVTHIMSNLSIAQEEMDLIVLEELINFLTNPEKEQERQKEKYEA